MSVPLPDSEILGVAAFAVAISVLSIYVSRRYLPSRINRAYSRSIAALAALVETRDSTQVGQSRRSAALSVAMAVQLGLRGRDLERVEYAALLMEVGKAKVPQRILRKSNPLTPNEWLALERHCELGAEMVAAVPFLSDVAHIILHHHEHWDGTGYPAELKGEEIPLLSRILHVAGDYEAMVSERAYRRDVLAAEQAAEEIRLGAGREYDPRVVAAFVEVKEAYYAEDEEGDAEISIGVA